MEITPALVKDLRERTGAGMMECKKALVEAKGDIADAEIILRKRGIASAGKKSARATRQGPAGGYGRDQLRVRFRGPHRRFQGAGPRRGHAHRRRRPQVAAPRRRA